MQIRPIFNSLDCHFSIEQFYSGRISKDIACIPFVGSVIGIGRFVFSIYQYATGAPEWTKDRLFNELSRSAAETLFMGVVLRVYELFFAESGTGTAAGLGFSFSSTPSRLFSAHTPQLISFYTATTPSSEQLRLYRSYRSLGAHSYQGQQLFNGTDFYVRHGLMHACFVTQFIPILISLYKNAGHLEADALNEEDILGIQITAFLHDYGRIYKGMDLIRDHEELERISAEAAYQYMRQALNFTEEKARRLSNYILNKDGPIASKPILQQVLQSCDSLAVLRADDWVFDKKYMDLSQWIDANIPVGSEHSLAIEQLNSVIDAAKQMLVDIGDSPFSMTCHSQALLGQTIRGHFSLATKRTYEKSPHCYELMLQQMRRYPNLCIHL